MTPEQADDLSIQVEGLDDRQLWLMIVWLWKLWVLKIKARYGIGVYRS